MMNETHIAKLFEDGNGQMVRLPAQFHFQGSEVYATRDNRTGDVVLSSQPEVKAWDEFFELLFSVDVPTDFMAERPMNEQR
jgi:antitoxin VapB